MKLQYLTGIMIDLTFESCRNPPMPIDALVPTAHISDRLIVLGVFFSSWPSLPDVVSSDRLQKDLSSRRNRQKMSVERAKDNGQYEGRTRDLGVISTTL
jgi:hypothetical protein